MVSSVGVEMVSSASAVISPFSAKLLSPVRLKPSEAISIEPNNAPVRSGLVLVVLVVRSTTHCHYRLTRGPRHRPSYWDPSNCSCSASAVPVDLLLHRSRLSGEHLFIAQGLETGGLQ